jgi:VanZ family protein
VLLFAVSKAQRFLKYWLPVLLWMALIFSASSDSFSFQHSSRIIAPILRWLIPHISEEAVHSVIVVVRKTAHVTEYAILAVLVLRLIRQLSWRRVSRAWLPDAVCALLIVILYAASDEFHQLFVPSREASVVDVAIDTSGAVLALLFIGVLARWRQRW